MYDLLTEEKQTWLPSSAELLIRAHALFADRAYRDWAYTKEYQTSERAMALIASGYSRGLTGEEIFKESLSVVQMGNVVYNERIEAIK